MLPPPNYCTQTRCTWGIIVSILVFDTDLSHIECEFVVCSFSANEQKHLKCTGCTALNVFNENEDPMHLDIYPNDI